MISLDRYAELLARPDVKRAVIASVVGRLPIGILGLAILLLAQSGSGSFAVGGSATGCYVAGLALVAPVLGRLIDRYGPQPVLAVDCILFPAVLVALVLAATSARAPWVVFTLAAAAGASFPPITVCMRSFLRRRLGEEQMLATAYSLESVLIETIFIVGPMLVALFVAIASAAVAVLFAAACGLIGTLLFLQSPALGQWRVERRTGTSLFGPLAEPGFLPLLLIILCYAAAFGLVEIGVAGYASEIGSPALAGVLLGIMSVGSVCGGLAYGSRSWFLPLPRQFALTLVLMGAGIALLVPQWSALPFAFLCAVAGIVMAPALIIQSMLVAKTARAEHATEAFTWASSGLLAGVGAGLAAGGAALEKGSASAALAAAAAATLLAGACAYGVLRRG